MHAAIAAAVVSLTLHVGTGRLWAILIQLCHRLECLGNPLPAAHRTCRLTTRAPVRQSDPFYDGEFTETDGGNDDVLAGIDLQLTPVPSKDLLLLRSLREVPKSGEVWCEGAR